MCVRTYFNLIKLRGVRLSLNSTFCLFVLLEPRRRWKILVTASFVWGHEILNGYAERTVEAWISHYTRNFVAVKPLSSLIIFQDCRPTNTIARPQIRPMYGSYHTHVTIPIKSSSVTCSGLWLALCSPLTFLIGCSTRASVTTFYPEPILVTMLKPANQNAVYSARALSQPITS